MSKFQRNDAPIADSVFDSVLPIIGGAVATMLVLALLKLDAAQVWAPLARSGPVTFKALAVSALGGGIATSVLGRRFSGPMAATACALGWALWGWALHFGAQGRYLDIAGGGFPREAMESLLFTNAVTQSLCVALALIVASAISWIWVRRRTGVTIEANPISDDDLDGSGLNSFSTAFFYPIATLIFGVIALGICGLPMRFLGNPTIEQLPSSPAVAGLCGLLTMLALFVATYAARRIFKAVSGASDVIAAPIVITLTAALHGAPFIKLGALLIWQTSAFELASWAALGASLGYSFARSKMKF